MIINDFLLRKKSAELCAQKNEKMSIQINKNLDPAIIENKGNKLYLIKDFSMSIVSEKMNIAAISLVFQCEVLLEDGEEFNSDIFSFYFMPILYSQISQLLAEMRLPLFSLSDFIKFANCD